MDAKIGTFIVGIANNIGCYFPIILLNSKSRLFNNCYRIWKENIIDNKFWSYVHLFSIDCTWNQTIIKCCKFIYLNYI